VKRGLVVRALLLDRDGTLNVDHGYVHTPAQFTWVEGAIDAVKYANDAGVLVLVVTNQSGIARGFYDEAAFHALCEWMRAELARHGARIDGFYFCPHGPDDGCNCRKPLPGMIERATREWGFDRATSVLVGDSERDIEAAVAAGVRGVRYTSGSLLDLVRRALL